MDCWDMRLDYPGHNCQCRMLTPRENKEENQEGPWEESLTVSGARFQPKQSFSQGASRTRHFFSTWA
eukprot:6710288-Prorocentrum_lima.AAC.1